MKVVWLTGALCGIFYQNSAIAKDQDGIVMFGGGNLGCAKYSSVQTKNNVLHVKCDVGDNISLTSIGKLSQSAVALLQVIGN